MKSKEEVIAKFARHAYSNYMNGDWDPMRGMGIDLAAWIFEVDYNDVYDAVEAEMNAMIKQAVEK